MVQYENECVGCPPNMGCIGSACSYQNVLRYYCDTCKDEVDELYQYDGEQLCLNCLLDIVGAELVRE